MAKVNFYDRLSVPKFIDFSIQEAKATCDDFTVKL